MTRKLFILLFGAAISGQANALCEVDLSEGGYPQTLTIPAFTVFIDADAPNSASQPIALEESAQNGILVSFHKCLTGSPYGRAVTSLVKGPAVQDRMFTTNIPGIVIKPMWNNGGGFGSFPSNSVFAFTNNAGETTEQGRANFTANTFYKVEIYKVADTLNLTNPDGDTILSSGVLAYNWLDSNSLASAGQKLEIGQITIISTPSCTFDGTRNVDFGIVTSGTLSDGGITRDIDFNITCKIDYGSYSGTAAISTQTPTADGNYIKVKDSQDQDDRLRIKISDGSGKQMKVNGSTTEQKINIASGAPAQFNWKATLESASVSNKPANGVFTAMAEIILQVK